MRCSGSQITCTAPDPSPRGRVANTFEALLFEQVLEPLVKPLGPAGEIAIALVAEATFVRSQPQSP